MNHPSAVAKRSPLTRILVAAPLTLALVATTSCTPSKESKVSSFENPTGSGAMAMRLLASDSSLMLSWLEPLEGESGSNRLLLSRYDGAAWSEARELTRGDRLFANWADTPGVAIGGGGLGVAHWLEKLGDDTYAYGATLTTTTDASFENWSPAGSLHDDQSPAEHGFVSYAPTAEGVQAFWLDGRAMLNGGSMQLRTTHLSAVANARGSPEGEHVLDDRVCECCPTDAAAADDGPLVVYRDRSPTEVRDISIIRFTDQGWSEPQRVFADNWSIDGCPVNGPAIAAQGQRVGVVWFSAPGVEVKVQAALSDDGGATFSSPIVLDDEHPIGRVDAVFDASGALVASFIARTQAGAEVRIRRIDSAGALGPPIRVGSTSASRSAGVPRMAQWRGSTYITWVDVDSSPGARIARLF